MFVFPSLLGNLCYNSSRVDARLFRQIAIGQELNSSRMDELRMTISKRGPFIALLTACLSENCECDNRVSICKLVHYSLSDQICSLSTLFVFGRDSCMNWVYVLGILRLTKCYIHLMNLGVIKLIHVTSTIS